jgi:hypothetical protein
MCLSLSSPSCPDRKLLQLLHVWKHGSCFKIHILLANPATFFEMLCHSDFGSTTVSTLQFLTHFIACMVKCSLPVVKNQNEFTPLFGASLTLGIIILWHSQDMGLSCYSLVNAAYHNKKQLICTLPNASSGAGFPPCW